MEGYSKIREIELFNFMCFKHTKLVFDETNILNLKGYNDSGKSTILRAMAVCLADMFKKAQSKYIRHGEEYFRIIVTFEDGVSVLRDKYYTGQSVYEMYKEGKLIYTTKQGNMPTRIEGVPVIIQEYLGLCMTDNGCLNYQSCEDKLFLVDTTGSENYQVLNMVLKSDEISRATAMINSDRNELNQRLIEMENEYNNTNAVLKSRSFVDEDLISDLEFKDKVYDYFDKRVDSLIAIGDVYDKIDELVSYPEMERLDVTRLQVIQNIKNCGERVSSLESIPVVGKIDTTQFEKLSKLKSLASSLKSKKSLPEIKRLDISRFKGISSLLRACDSLSELPDIPVVEGLDSSRLKDIQNIGFTLNSLNSYISIPKVDEVGKDRMPKVSALSKMQGILGRLSSIDEEIKGINLLIDKTGEELDDLAAEANKDGMKYVVCPNCGTFVSMNQ